MTLLVDAAAGAVVDGERRWPLRLDCRTGAAVVTFGDRELAIAPLQLAAQAAPRPVGPPGTRLRHEPARRPRP